MLNQLYETWIKTIVYKKFYNNKIELLLNSKKSTLNPQAINQLQYPLKSKPKFKYNFKATKLDSY